MHRREKEKWEGKVNEKLEVTVDYRMNSVGSDFGVRVWGAVITKQSNKPWRISYMMILKNKIIKWEVIKLWVIFLLSALGYALIALIVLWIGNKVINAIKKENSKVDKILKKESEEK